MAIFWVAKRGEVLKVGLILIEPTIRFEGMPEEQATMFLEDYSQNALEFKSFRNPNEVFSQ